MKYYTLFAEEYLRITSEEDPARISSVFTYDKFIFYVPTTKTLYHIHNQLI